MKTKGYILIQIEPGWEMEAYESFKKLEGVTDISPLLGDIDFILALERDSPDDIAMLVIKTIRRIPGVLTTKTLIQDDFVKHFEVLA